MKAVMRAFREITLVEALMAAGAAGVAGLILCSLLAQVMSALR